MRADAGAYHNGCRRGEPQCTRTRNHQHRDESEHRGRKSLSNKYPPREERRKGNSDNDWHEHTRNCIGCALDRCLALLRRLHELNQARERSFRTDARRFNREQAALVNCRGSHL